MRTQYFQNIQPGHNNSIKRINSAGQVEYAGRYPNSDKPKWSWSASTFTKENLSNPRHFKRITRDEARKLNPSLFRSVKQTVTVVAAVAGTVIKPGIELANKFRQAVAGLDYGHSQKIAAIKAIRSIEGFGLAESKMIVENFDKFIEFVETHNELPLISWDFNHPFSKRTENRIPAV